MVLQGLQPLNRAARGMRLNLYWRGRDVIDVELHVWKKREERTLDGNGPTLQATGGGQAERAEPYGDPATQHGFGFSA
jgi:hypothetical protein